MNRRKLIKERNSEMRKTIVKVGGCKSNIIISNRKTAVGLLAVGDTKSFQDTQKEVAAADSMFSTKTRT